MTRAQISVRMCKERARALLRRDEMKPRSELIPAQAVPGGAVPDTSGYPGVERK
jgi:hypothetical protein